MIQQQQKLNLTKQKSPSKDIEGHDAPNHSTGDQSPTGDILSQTDLEEDVDCQTGPKISESLDKRVEFKWQTKLTLDQLKNQRIYSFQKITQSYPFHLRIKKCSHNLITPREKLTYGSGIYKRIFKKQL